MKESLMACVESQISGNLANVDAKELGEAVDMIKDLSEAIYYCTITKAMKEDDDEEKSSKKQQQQQQMPQQQMYQQGGGSGGGSNYYTPMYYPPMYNDGSMYNNGQNYNSGSMYAEGGGNSGGNNARGGGSRGYQNMPMGQMRDYREGNSPMYRRMYMEGKHEKDPQKQMKELEDYMHELTNDIMEMIEDATPEEKQLLRQKITTLSTKIK